MTQPPKLRVVTPDGTIPEAPPPPPNPEVTQLINLTLADHLKEDTSALITIRVLAGGENSNYLHLPSPDDPDGLATLRMLHFYLARLQARILTLHDSSNLIENIAPDDEPT
jgi:hypothetical protein